MIETSDMQFDSRMVTAEETPEDHDVEVTLRPQTLAEYIGQDKVKENMAIYIQAAKRRGDPSRIAVWAAGAWKDNTFRHHCP